MPEFSYINSMTFTNAKQGVDAGDHPPITPTTNRPMNLAYEDEKLYNYICQHFLASIAQDAIAIK